MRACACGLRTVCPQSIPGATRSLEYANSPFTFGTPSARSTTSPMRPTSSRRGDDEPGCAEPALDGTGLDERLLHRVQGLAFGEPLDRRHLVAVRLGGEHEAGADEHAVEQHRTGTALSLLTRVLRARIPELLAERKEQRLPLPAVRLGLDAVHAQRDPHACASVLSSARRVNTRSA